MGLAIDGNEVHGIARGGQAFLPYSNKLFDFSKAVFDTKIYFSKNALIGESDVNNGHFTVAFQYASDRASTFDDFSDCRIVGATYISEANVDTNTPTILNAGAGLYYLFSVYSYSSDTTSYYPNGTFLIRADQVVFKSSGSSNSSMMS
ncbi:hypothetical protein [Lactobacillus helveticus]|uniref:hypothetical protein n=1 Tax=Lactobacillus helveticus TaxID=1587 RepID=UPI00156513E7|nr:hypothetical protein [Lactobacillus helveticus]NRO92827.1 hypothetical protein [Lactobacillus helveticus]